MRPGRNGCREYNGETAPGPDASGGSGTGFTTPVYDAVITFARGVTAWAGPTGMLETSPSAPMARANAEPLSHRWYIGLSYPNTLGRPPCPGPGD